MSYMELFYPENSHSSWMGNNSSSSDSSYRYSNSYDRSYPPMQSTVVLHVTMCCEKCAHKVRKSLKNVEGIESVDVDMQRQKVIVSGYVNPERVLSKVRKVKKSATYWNSSHDYANYSTGAYDYYGPSSRTYENNYYNPRSSSYDNDYYSPSSSYDYTSNYPNTYDYDYPSFNSYNDNSYEAYRYR